MNFPRYEHENKKSKKSLPDKRDESHQYFMLETISRCRVVRVNRHKEGAGVPREPFYVWRVPSQLCFHKKRVGQK